MKYYCFIILQIVMFSCAKLNAQVLKNDVIWPKLGKNDTIRVASTNDNGYMIPWIALPEVVVYGERIWKSDADRAAYNRLKYNVLKVMPYALFAKRRYEQLERDLALTDNRREQRKLVKACDQEIKKMFDAEIKELTITQGQILTKLIDREIGKNTYDIIKQAKGGFAAFSYQLIARIVGHNLKATYSATEDRDIESIIVNSGYYQ